MTRSRPRIFTIAPGLDPLRLIARRVLDGSLIYTTAPLHAWTILLPTRRAARRLGDLFLAESQKKSLILPRIQPIGDVDTEAMEAWPSAHTIPDALSAHGLLFEIVKLIETWIAGHGHLSLAADLAASSQQRFNLARSLSQLVVQAETEEVDLGKIAAVYDFTDIAGHREAIVGLLEDLNAHLQLVFLNEKRIGAAAHRNAMIRLKADYIKAQSPQQPYLVAGSTGTNPATRELMGVIANLPLGGLVLPGLDHTMEDADWLSVGQSPTHPQWGLKTLVDALKTDPSEIEDLADPRPSRLLLLRDIMRPSERTHVWAKSLPPRKADISREAKDVHLVGADDRHIEARVIALIMRETLETADKTAALITPDRELAQRVKAELLRWNVSVDDSAGEPLTRFGLAALAVALIDCIATDFSPATLVALLHQTAMSCGLAGDDYGQAARGIDILLLRQQAASPGLDGLEFALARALDVRTTKAREHPVAAQFGEDSFQNMAEVVACLRTATGRLTNQSLHSLEQHVAGLTEAILALAAPPDWTAPANAAFAKTLVALKDESFRLPPMRFADAAQIVLLALRNEVVRMQGNSHQRLAIYGLLEARMMVADVAILGGLNEDTWPRQPDPGPWLNRPMRTALALQQPERDIGLTAHDFCEGLGHGTVYLTWSKRAGLAPLVASRWILRLVTVLDAAGLLSRNSDGRVTDSPEAVRLLSMAHGMDRAQHFAPVKMPRPNPPLVARPRNFSVTEIETLNRDPYAIFARKILGLSPLEKLTQDSDPRLLGTLFHDALALWNHDGAVNADRLRAAGTMVFERFMDDPHVALMWWPRFLAMADWVVAQEGQLHENLLSIHQEISGELDVPAGGVIYKLRGRADRIDILKDGTARIIDYKTGKPPTVNEVETGFSPQLTLEAAMVARGVFKPIAAVAVSEAYYLQISGQREPGKAVLIRNTQDGKTFADLVGEHHAGLVRMLTAFGESSSLYLPRVKMKTVDAVSDYDQLSRHLEWSLTE